MGLVYISTTMFLIMKLLMSCSFFVFFVTVILTGAIYGLDLPPAYTTLAQELGDSDWDLCTRRSKTGVF